MSEFNLPPGLSQSELNIPFYSSQSFATPSQRSEKRQPSILADTITPSSGFYYDNLSAGLKSPISFQDAARYAEDLHYNQFHQQQRAPMKKGQSFKQTPDHQPMIRQKAEKHKTIQPRNLGDITEDPFDMLKCPQDEQSPSIEKAFQEIKGVWSQQSTESSSIKQSQISYIDQDFTSLSDQMTRLQIREDIQLSSQIENLWSNQVISRQLQKMLETGRPEQKEFIVAKLERMCPQIAKDIFGNYVVQQVFEKCEDNLRFKLFTKLLTHFTDLSKNMFGCRVMQKIVQFTKDHDNLQGQLISQLQDNLKTLIYDTYGNYVIHKMLEVYSPHKLVILIQISTELFGYMLQQPYGCKIIVRIMELYQKKDLKTIIEQIYVNLDRLAQSEGGNKIIQEFITRCPEYHPYLLEYVHQRFYDFSLNKYASNTVEKILELADTNYLSVLLWQLLQMPVGKFNEMRSMFTELSTSASGNYVIKKLLIQSDQITIAPMLVEYFKGQPQQLNMIRASKYGIKTFLNLQGKRYPHCLTNSSSSEQILSKLKRD